jgi:hypothetical protein
MVSGRSITRPGSEPLMVAAGLRVFMQWVGVFALASMVGVWPTAVVYAQGAVGRVGGEPGETPREGHFFCGQ